MKDSSATPIGKKRTSRYVYASMVTKKYKTPGPQSCIFHIPMVDRVQTIRPTRGNTMTSSIAITPTSTQRIFRTDTCPGSYKRIWG